MNQLFLALVFCFFSWIIISLIAWTNINGEIIAFLWPFFGVFAGLVSIISIYFIYVFLHKKDVPFSYKLTFLALLSPLILLAPSNLSVSGFNITYCDSFGFEGLAYKTYYTSLGILSMLWILGLLMKSYRKANDYLKKQILYVGIGIEFFLILFFFVVSVVTYLVNIGILSDSRLEMYGLFGILIFVVSIVFVIVRYKAFDIKLAAPVALVGGLWVLVFSLLFVRNIEVVQVIVSITLFFLFIFGYALIKSIRNEIKQREEIEKLAKSLRKTNLRLRELDKQKSEFVAIASHQLRSPLTAISGYASLLKSGDFGRLPARALDPVDRIYTSARSMAQSIEEYLNVSQIESGSMKYNLTDFSLREMVENISDDLRPEVLRSGLLLFFKTDLSSRAIVRADKGKITQAIHNLINNSIKYTQKGTITVLVRDNVELKRIYVEVIDTGVGMSESTISNLFQKFERADNAHEVNVQGSGLGLYMALKITEAMGGTISAYSEGEGKGSKFVLELTLVV